MASIRVVVTDDQRKPIPGARFVFAREGGRDGRTVSADATGLAVVDRIQAPGVYEWAAEAAGHVRATGTMKVRVDGRVVDRPGTVSLPRQGSVGGRVTGEGIGLAGVPVNARDALGQSAPQALTNAGGEYRIVELNPGPFQVSVDPPADRQAPPARAIVVAPGQHLKGVDFDLPLLPLPVPVPAPSGPTAPGPAPVVSGPPPIEFTPSGPSAPAETSITTGAGPIGPPLPPIDPADDGPIASFFRLIDDPQLSVEQPINEPEAEEAITLFSVSNVVLAGRSRVRVGTEVKPDVLGILALYYGLRDKSIQKRLTVRSKSLWPPIQDALKPLRDRLDVLGSDLAFLEREARRQFNVGGSNDVVGNGRFTSLFTRYVEIGTSPLLTLDLRDDASEYVDNTRITRAFDLLAELKGVVLLIVRSLSRYGTVATRETNAEWAAVAKAGLDVLDRIARERSTDDLDDQNVFAVLSDVTGVSRAAILPHVVLAKHGGPLLRLAMEVYRDAKPALEDSSREHLLRLFQPEGDPARYRTEALRRHAVILRRYPLAVWQ